MRPRVARNTAFLLAGQILDKATSYLFLIYITRFFGSELYGIYVTAATFVTMAGNLVDFGLYNLVLRDVAQDRSRVREYLGRILPLRIGLAIAAIALIQAAARLLGYPREVVVLAGIASLSLLIGVPGGLLMAGINAMEHIQISAFCSIAGNVLTTLFSILALHFGIGLRGVFLGWLAAGVISFVLVSAGAKQVDVGISPRIDWPHLQRAIRDALPFATLALAPMALSADVLILSWWHGATATGLYSAARRPLELLWFIPASFMGALYPLVAAQYTRSKAFVWQTYQQSLQFLIWLAIPFAIGLIMLRERIIVILFGDAFLDAAHAVPFLALALAISFFSAPATILIFSAHRTRQFVPYVIGNSLAGVVLNLLLVPTFGFVGASVVMLMTTLGGFFVQRHFMGLIFDKKPAFAMLSVRPLVAAGVMAAILRIFWSVQTIPLIGIGGLAYGAALWALGGTAVGRTSHYPG